MDRTEIYQRILNLSNEQKLSEAKEAYKQIMATLKAEVGERDAVAFFLAIVGTFLAADNKLTMSEFYFLRDILGIPLEYETVLDLAEHSTDPAMVEKIDEVVDLMPKDLKIKLVALGMIICACDGEITVSEQQLIEKYLRD